MAKEINLKEETIIRIVDDDADIRDALSFMLECKGWQVRAYSSAREFLTQDSPSIPGCLLLDIRMPDMSGVQLQTLMKKQRMHLPIIFITGHADVDTAVATLKAGALDFLQNPLTRSPWLKPSNRQCASVLPRPPAVYPRVRFRISCMI